MPKVKAALAQLSSDEVKAFKASGSIDVAGQTLSAGDLSVSASVDFSTNPDFHGGQGDTTQAKEDGELIVVVDVRSSPELVSLGLARGFISSIQQLRKKAGLVATDDVDVFYRGESEAMKAAIEASTEAIWRDTKSAAVEASQMGEGRKVLLEDEVEVANEKVKVSLVERATRD